jgi:hypothetical protein
MSLLLKLVFRSVCRSTHERLAVDALRHLRGPDAEWWSDLLLNHYGEYLAGASAPDERFKDFRNHVVHVADNMWGGAPQEARRWYGRLVDAARRREWAEAVFAAGALSHYFSDPFLPLNTARSEKSTKIQTALQWCIGQSYGRLQQVIEHDLGGYPQLETPRGDDWLERMISTGAELANAHFQTVLERFDLERAARDPQAGMDGQCEDCVAECLGHAVVGFARVLERAIREAEVEPPTVETTLQGFIVAATAPLRWLEKSWAEMSERMTIAGIADEAQRTGKVVRNLPEEEREIRRLYAEEVLHVSLHELDQQPADLTGTLYGSGCGERYHANHLITTPVYPRDGEISKAWREAQQRWQQRRRIDVSPVLDRRAG